MRHHMVLASCGLHVLMKWVSAFNLTVNETLNQSVLEKLLSVCCVYLAVSVCLWKKYVSVKVTAWQVRFSSFPPHLPRAHHCLLSQSVSSETTYVSCRALRAELSDERKLTLHKMHTCKFQTHIPAHTRMHQKVQFRHA